jgi:anti-anti-sigma regulatory factor
MTYQPGLGVEAVAVDLKGAFLFDDHLAGLLRAGFKMWVCEGEKLCCVEEQPLMPSWAKGRSTR